MDAPHTWWTPLAQQLATGFGSAFIAASTVAITNWLKRARTATRIDQLEKDIQAMQIVQGTYADNLSRLRQTFEEAKGLQRNWERDLGRLEGKYEARDGR